MMSTSGFSGHYAASANPPVAWTASLRPQSPKLMRPTRVSGKGMGKQNMSESKSLFQEMKMKQEWRNRRKELQQELEALGREAGKSGQGDLTRMGELRVQLASIEEYLARTGSAIAEPESTSQSAPACVQEDADSSNLYIGSLAPAWTEEMMSREFGRFGVVLSVKIMYPRTGRQLACGMNTGFVQFANRKQAESAKAAMNGRECFGMNLHVEFSRPVAAALCGPVVSIGNVMRPELLSGLGLNRIGIPGGLTMQEGPRSSAPTDASASPQEHLTKRRSKFDMAKTFSIVIPSCSQARLLVDRTAQFVSMDGWDFEKLLFERERDNPRFAFLWADEKHEDYQLHLYYRWRTFSLLQGDSIDFWRVEPFQIYENGALWQPPACDHLCRDPVSVASSSVQRTAKGGSSSSAGGAELAPSDVQALERLLAEKLGPGRSSILEVMSFCLDNATCSKAIARRICDAITHASLQVSVGEVSVRLFLLSDVLFNAHCAKPGAAMYRRQFQHHLPVVFKRLREICEGMSQLASHALRERATQLVRIWGSWSSFPRQFTQGLEATLRHTIPSEDLQRMHVRWACVQDQSVLERECRTHGLATGDERVFLVERLCYYETYWGERLAPEGAEDPELDGEPLDEMDWSEALKLQSSAAVQLIGIRGLAVKIEDVNILNKLGVGFAGDIVDTVCAKEVVAIVPAEAPTAASIEDNRGTKAAVDAQGEKPYLQTFSPAVISLEKGITFGLAGETAGVGKPELSRSAVDGKEGQKQHKGHRQSSRNSSATRGVSDNGPKSRGGLSSSASRSKEKKKRQKESAETKSKSSPGIKSALKQLDDKGDKSIRSDKRERGDKSSKTDVSKSRRRSRSRSHRTKSRSRGRRRT